MMDGVSMLHVTFDLDNGLLRLSGGHLPYSTVQGRPGYPGLPDGGLVLSFSARTSEHTNNHWVTDISTDSGGHTLLNPLPASDEADLPLPIPLAVTSLALVGSATVGPHNYLELTQLENNQEGQAYYSLADALPDGGGDFGFSVRYEMYTGDGSGADGQCVSVGANDLGGRNGEDGVSVGVAVCFDEYSNGGDHGISIFYNGEALFEDLAPCENQEGCEPVSLFNDGAWHVVRVEIVPADVGGGAQVVVKLDPVAGLSYGRTVGCKAQDSSLSTLSFAGCTHVLTRL